MKRGFTFYHHRRGEIIDPRADYGRQLLVAASPHDEIGDTHWYRTDFDAFLVEKAPHLGVDYRDDVKVEQITLEPGSVRISGTRNREQFALKARFLIDATGPRGLLHQRLNLPEAVLPGYQSTQALWSHFRDVARRPDSILSSPPYPPEDAAVHHVFEGGWIWVLHFNNGITSAGVAVTDSRAKDLRLADGEAAWNRLINEMPSLKTQFSKAKAVEPIRLIPRLSFLSEQVAGESWALLPSAAGFVDPLLSTGFPLTLLGVDRLAQALERGLDAPTLEADLALYASQTRNELLATARLVAALYANMDNFAVFRALTLLYFSAAGFSETARRLGKPHLAPSFLLHDHPQFGAQMQSILDRAMRSPQGEESIHLLDDIHDAIEPIDVAGLSKPNATNWYPVSADDLLDAHAKVDATKDEIGALLQRCGFYAIAPPR